MPQLSEEQERTLAHVFFAVHLRRAERLERERRADRLVGAIDDDEHERTRHRRAVAAEHDDERTGAQK